MSHQYLGQPLKAILILLFITGLSCQQKAVGVNQVSDKTALTDTAALTADSNEVLKIAYIGNMGVLLESGTQTIIIDGLHEFYKPDYVFPKLATVNQLIQGNYPAFTPIELAMVTHHHGDHFSSSYCRDFLRHNTEAILLGPDQVYQDLAIPSSQKQSERVKIISYDRQINTIDLAGIHVKALRCDHVNPARHQSIQNIAYLIDLNGYKILHVGDTNWSPLKRSLPAFDLPKVGLDVAILPYWMLMEIEAKQWIAEILAPQKVIATHLPPAVSKKEEASLRQFVPNATFLLEQDTLIKINPQ